MWLSKTAAIVIPPARTPWLPGWKTYLTRTALFPTASQQLWMGVASCQISTRQDGEEVLPACLPACPVPLYQTDSKFIFTSAQFQKKKKKRKPCRVEHLIKVWGRENTTAGGVSPPCRQRGPGARLLLLLVVVSRTLSLCLVQQSAHLCTFRLLQ